MRTRRWSLVAGLALVMLLALPTPGVAGKQKSKAEGPPPSGFLGDYSGLEPHPKQDHLLVYRKAPGVLEPYRRFLIDKPVVMFHPEARGAEIDPEELDMLAGALREAVVEALEKDGAYEVVEQPGPGVLRLRAAITDVDPVKPGKNVAPKAAGMAAGVGLLVPRTDLGRAAIEVEMLDSRTDERLVAVAASKKGRRYFSTIKGAKRWGDVKAAFKSWAKLFRKRLDEIHRGE